MFTPSVKCETNFLAKTPIKNFRFADPVIHEDLFKLAEQYVYQNQESINQKKYSFLLKLFDRAEILNIEEI